MPESASCFSQAADSSEIVSSRVFAASKDRLFEAFSDPRRLAQWWGPKGFINRFREFEFRPGGAWRFTMADPNGAEYDNQSRFTEISKPDLIRFEHLEPGHWYRMTMTFAAEGAGTRMTWRMEFATSEEVRKIGGFIIGANEENFDRLEACLASGGGAS